MSNPRLRLAHVALPAPDMPASIAFYECLGGERGFTRRDDTGRITLIQVQMGAGFIELLADAPVPGSGHFAFSTDDIDAIWSRLADNGHAPLAAPASGASGVRWFFVRDPAGNLVEITMPDMMP